MSTSPDPSRPCRDRGPHHRGSVGRSRLTIKPREAVPGRVVSEKPAVSCRRVCERFADG
jgi:hypothetical protein